MMTLLLLGALVGAVLGLTGAGGGILAVPALMLALGWTVTQAMPVALLAVAMSAGIGAWGAWRQGLVRYRAATLMAAVGIPFTSLGVQAGSLFTSQQLSLLFAALMLYIGIRQWLNCKVERVLLTAPSGTKSLSLCEVDQQTGRIVWTWPSAFMIAAIGGVTGFFTGLLGVGGGFIMVPLLRRITQVSTQGIIATALLVIAMVASGGVVLSVMHGTPLPLDVALPFALSACVGMLASRKLIPYIPSRCLRCGFAVLVLLVAVGVAIRAV